MSEKTILMERFRELVFESVRLYAGTDSTAQINLASEAAQHNLATFITGYLSSFINDCEDEINSLQFMLDEIQNSQKALNSPELYSELNDSINAQIAKLKMMQNLKGDA
mgnify:CR=1 FL=1